jgi:hypothetical protein
MNSALVYKDVLREPNYPARQHLSGKLLNGVLCKDFLLPRNFPQFGDRIRTMDVRPDDTWICSFPRSGKWPFFFPT